MEKFGVGFCDAGYYARWDGKGIESHEACKKVCMAESECTYAASMPGSIATGTCSRYKGETCSFSESSSEDFFAYVTFKKQSAGILKYQLLFILGIKYYSLNNFVLYNILQLFSLL